MALGSFAGCWCGNSGLTRQQCWTCLSCCLGIQQARSPGSVIVDARVSPIGPPPCALVSKQGVCEPFITRACPRTSRALEQQRGVLQCLVVVGSCPFLRTDAICLCPTWSVDASKQSDAGVGGGVAELCLGCSNKACCACLYHL